MNEYVLGQKISWGYNEYGEPGHHCVLAEGISGPCKNCSKEFLDFDVLIVDDVIVEVIPFKGERPLISPGYIVIETIMVNNSDCVSESVDVECISENRYRLHSFCLLGDYSYGDVIVVRKRDDGTFDVLEHIPNPVFKQHCILMTQQMQHSADLEILRKKIESEGGQWQQDMGGIFVFNVPANKQHAIQAMLNHFLRGEIIPDSLKE